MFAKQLKFHVTIISTIILKWKQHNVTQGFLTKSLSILPQGKIGEHDSEGISRIFRISRNGYHSSDSNLQGQHELRFCKFGKF